jgi:hypothetical protein
MQQFRTHTYEFVSFNSCTLTASTRCRVFSKGTIILITHKGDRGNASTTKRRQRKKERTNECRISYHNATRPWMLVIIIYIMFRCATAPLFWICTDDVIISFTCPRGGIRPKINPNCHTHTHTGLKTGLNILLHLLITMHTETLLSPVRILLNYKLKNKCELRQSRSCWEPNLATPGTQGNPREESSKMV